MANFSQVIRAIRGADQAERDRQLQILRDAFVPPVVDDPKLKAALDEIRNANQGRRRQLLGSLVEEFRPDDPDEPKERKKSRAVASLTKFLDDERKGGRPRPNRRAIEAHIRNIERLTQDELDEALADLYNQAVALGAVPPRA